MPPPRVKRSKILCTVLKWIEFGVPVRKTLVSVRLGYFKETALLFLKIGATAFGGPAAYIAIMQRETVRRRGRVDDGG